MIDDLDDGVFRGLLRLILWLLRVLWWLAWEVGVEGIGWSIGWVVCRMLTLGHYPRVGIGQQDALPWPEALLVEITGLAVLGGAVWVLETRFGIF